MIAIQKSGTVRQARFHASWEISLINSSTTCRSGFDPFDVRKDFPALNRTGPMGLPWVFMDGPGGTQVPASVAAAMADAILTASANRGAPFQTSRNVEAIMHQAGEDGAAFLGVNEPDRVIFGPNMTTLAFHAADAILPTLTPGDEVIVSCLDHDANVSPWIHAANRAGATVRYLPFCQESMTIRPGDLASLLTSRTKLIAFTAASNALGSLTPVSELIRVARGSKALVVVDGTHYAPHHLPCVDDWGVDLFFCSAYKFFGPHVGLMTGKRSVLESLNPAKVRPAANTLPVRWMTGTQNHEGIAGFSAAICYLRGLGKGRSPREQLSDAYQKISRHETALMEIFMDRLNGQNHWRLTGIGQADPRSRVATFALRGPVSPQDTAHYLAEQGICAYSGNFYALPVTEALGMESVGGFLRVGAVHYNTGDEIHRLWDSLDHWANH